MNRFIMNDHHIVNNNGTLILVTNTYNGIISSWRYLLFVLLDRTRCFDLSC